MIDGKEFYNNMHRDHPDRWEVPNGGHHAFDLNVKEIVHKIVYDKWAEVKLIDLGCGTGRTLELIHIPFDIYKVNNLYLYGVDYSEEAVKIAEKRVPNAHIYVENMCHVSFTDSNFDIVLSVGSHEHQEILDFSEPRRLVRKDGWFICVLPNKSKSLGLTLAADGQHYDWELTKEDWIARIEPFGFKFIEYREPWTFVFRPTN